MRPFLYRLLRAPATPAFKLAFRVDVSGREHVPRDGPVILASVHRSYLDIPMVGLLTRRPVHFMAKAELWERRFSRWFCEKMGSFPVKRGEPDRSALESSLEVLERGGVLALFPEGTRQEGAIVQKCHGGVAYLAQKTGATVIPVAIVGSDRAMGLGASYPRPRKIRVRADRAIDLHVPGFPLARRAAREKGTQMLRSELQRLYDELRDESSSAR